MIRRTLTAFRPLCTKGIASIAVALATLALAGLAPGAGHAGLAAQETLRVGRTVQGTLTPGDTARFTVPAGEDYFLYGEVNQIDVDVVVRVLDPEGNARGRYDTPARGPEIFSTRLGEAGDYTIEVTPFEEESGAYEILLFRLEPRATDPRRLADQLMAPYDRDDGPGGAVRVWRDGRTLFSQAYGMANLTYGIPFREDTPTNIGSTSKQFTAFAVLLQEARGHLSLDDDIRTHIPELPEFDHVITVEHLLTHTTGLREFINLLLMTGRRVDHGDWVGREEIIEIVQRQPALQNVPGAEFNYNNTAFALAAEIVARTSGKEFQDFMREEVFLPLGMTRTWVRADRELIIPDRSVGYTPGGSGYRDIGDLGGAMGAGGIYSTVGDLQRWAQASLDPDPAVGSAEIFQRMRTSYVLNDGEETGYGYGLFIDDQGGLIRVHHGGADTAHRSMLVYFPEINAGLTVQSNHASFNSQGTAFELTAAFFRDEMEEEETGESVAEDFDPASYDPEDFDEFVGRYALDVAPSFILTFFREGDTLFTQATGQPRIEIRPTSDTTFALTVVEASIAFHRTEDGVEGLTLYQNGENHATRLEGDTPEAWTPTAQELEAFAGRYYSEELETFYTFRVEVPGEGEGDPEGEGGPEGEADEEGEADGPPRAQLVGNQRRMGDAVLTPGEPDTFSGGGLNLEFERDRNGEVIGFYVSNGRTRDVRFQRVR